MNYESANPQPADPFRPKIRLQEFCRRYGISVATGLRWIALNKIKAEQPGGPRSTWWVWLENSGAEDSSHGEALLLEEIERAARAQ